MNQSKLTDWTIANQIYLKDLAVMLGVHYCTIFLWGKGLRRPGHDKMITLKTITKGVISSPRDLLNRPASRKN